MRPALLAAIAVVASGSAAMVSTLQAVEAARLARTIALETGSSVSVESTVGDITVRGSDRRDLFVEIERRVPSSPDLAKLPGEIEQRDRRVAIRVVQAEEAKDPTLRSEITIEAPAGSRFEAIRLAEGQLTLSNLRGGVTALVKRGPIAATALSGLVRLETGIGALTLEAAELAADGAIHLRTFNGNTRLSFASRPADARILALTLNGTITSDLPLTMKDRFGPRFGEATLGRGAPVVSIDVVTGNIAIKSPPG